MLLYIDCRMNSNGKKRWQLLDKLLSEEFRNHENGNFESKMENAYDTILTMKKQGTKLYLYLIKHASCVCT